MNSADKVSFARQVLEFAKSHTEEITAKGYDMATAITDITSLSEAYSSADEGQLEAMAAMKEATKNSNTALDEYYTKCSATVEVIAALLGKEDELVQELRKIRK